jgi:hypothetical protein
MLPVPGYEGLYAVFDRGRVFRTAPGSRTRPGKVLKLTPDTHGYLFVRLCDGAGRRPTHLVHRLVALAFLGQPPEGRGVVDHRDSDRTNNHADNLQWVSVSENNRLTCERDRSRAPRGELNGQAKLTADAVREIRALRGSVAQREIAERFGVAQWTVSAIQLRQLWAHVN